MPSSITAKREEAHICQRIWYLYVLETGLGQLYTGITTEPLRRLRQHRGELTGGAKSLRGKGPLKFRAVYQVGGRSSALKLELSVKKLSRAGKNALLAGQHELYQQLTDVSGEFA